MVWAQTHRKPNSNNKRQTHQHHTNKQTQSRLPKKKRNKFKFKLKLNKRELARSDPALLVDAARVVEIQEAVDDHCRRAKAGFGERGS